MRQCGNHHVAVFPFEAGAQPHRAIAGLVQLAELLAGGDDLGAAGIIRRGHEFAESVQVAVGMIQQMDTGGGDFAEIVRWDVGGHADGDAGNAIEQDVRQAGGQPHGFVQRAIEIGYPVHRALAEFGQQHLRERRQSGLGVAHGGERLGIVRRAPVALPVHQWITVGEGLGHQHHGFIAGRVAMRVVFAKHVADGTSGFLVLGIGRQPEFGHGVDDTPLHRFQAVPDVRQGPVENDVHGIIQVRFFGEGF